MTLKDLFEHPLVTDLSILHIVVASLWGCGVGWVAARKAPEGVDQEFWEQYKIPKRVRR